jgi:hypothetical protein
VFEFSHSVKSNPRDRGVKEYEEWGQLGEGRKNEDETTAGREYNS